MVWSARTHLQGLSLSSTRSGLTPEGIGWRLARCSPHFFASCSWSDFVFMIWSSSSFTFISQVAFMQLSPYRDAVHSSSSNAMLSAAAQKDKKAHNNYNYSLPRRQWAMGNGQGGKRLFHICFAPFQTPFLCVDDTTIHTNLNWGKSQSLGKGKNNKRTSMHQQQSWWTQTHAKIYFKIKFQIMTHSTVLQIILKKAEFFILIWSFNCVTQLKLDTVENLSSSIFCCLCVCEASVTPDQMSTFSNIYRHTSPLLTQYNI